VYVQVAQYRLARGSVAELADRAGTGPLRAMPDVPGFIAYYAFQAGDDMVASVSVFEDAAGVQEAERRLADWVERTVAEFQISPGEVREGEVFASG
jgi:hypothetical protein